MQTDANHHSDEPAGDRARSSRPRPTLTLLAIVVLLALPVRLYLALTATMVSRDGVTFMWYAQRLGQDPLAEMRRQAQHPLYPAMILAAHSTLQKAGGLLRPVSASVGAVLDDPVQSWTLAGMSVTFLGGLAVVVAVYELAGLLFNHRVGLLAAVLAALAAEFCQLSADALTDMPHLALYLFGLCAAIQGLRVGWSWLLAAGMLSGSAFLMRPEGAGVAVVAAIGAILLARPWRLRRRLAGALAVVIGAGLIASPYMLITGKLVQKKSIARFLSVESCGTPKSTESALAMIDPTPAAAGSAGAKLAKIAGLIVEHWARALRVMLLLPAIVWLFLHRRAPAQAPAAWLACAAGSLHILILFGLVLGFEYTDLFSVRHTIILAGLTLPFSAAGLAAIVDGLPERRRMAVGALIVAGLVAPTAPWMLERRFAHEAYLRRAGEWIRTQQPAGAKVHTTRYHVAFYANGVWQWSPRDDEIDVARILSEARAYHPDWMAFDLQRILKRFPSFLLDLERAARPGELEPVKDFTQQAKGRVERVVIFRYHLPG